MTLTYILIFISLLFCGYMVSVYLQYVYDVPYNTAFIPNIFGPVEYTIRKATEYNEQMQRDEHYYKIHYNIFPKLKKYGLNFEKSNDMLIFLAEHGTMISNYFITYEDAENFINNDRRDLDYKINHFFI